MKKILFATTNEGKMREIRMIMEGSGYEITSLKDAGIKVDIDENGSTFEENALIKANALPSIIMRISRIFPSFVVANNIFFMVFFIPYSFLLFFCVCL